METATFVYTRRSSAKRAAQKAHPDITRIEFEAPPAPEAESAALVEPEVEPVPSRTRTEPSPNAGPGRGRTRRNRNRSRIRLRSPSSAADAGRGRGSEGRTDLETGTGPAVVFQGSAGWKYRIVGAAGVVETATFVYPRRSSARRAAQKAHPDITRIEFELPAPEAESAALVEPEVDPKPSPAGT